jgi:transcriptional regulator with XRE-family HTH domain/predicted Zn-ribbon and HTH transcriptional regulator
MANLWYFDVLAYRPQPFAGECLSGYLLRLAEANGQLAVQAFIGQLFPTRQKRLSISIFRWEYPVDNWGELPQFSQLSLPELEKMTILPWVAKFRMPPVRQYPDLSSPGTFLQGIIDPNLRVCPLCLQEEPYIRLLWRLAPVRACLRHSCYLQGQCHHCQQKLTAIGWRHRHLRCTGCGADLRTLPVTPASPEWLDREVRQQRDFQYLQDPDVMLVNGKEPVLPEHLPQAIGLKFRYLRSRTGLSCQQMGQHLGISAARVTRIERGDRPPLQTYLVYLDTLSYSWPEFAALTMPPDFSDTYDQPAYPMLRFCPDVNCPNHRLSEQSSIHLVRDNVKSQTVRFQCLGCGQTFTRHYSGELVIPSRPRSQSAKRAKQQQAKVQRQAELRSQVEKILMTLCEQDEEITLEKVGRILKRSVTYLRYYDGIVQRIQAVAQTHNNQRQQRLRQQLQARAEAVFSELADRQEPATIRKVASILGLTVAQLYQIYPELWAMVRQAVQVQKERLKELRRQERCERIAAAAVCLETQDQPLTITRLLKEAEINISVYMADPIFQDFVRQQVWLMNSRE